MYQKILVFGAGYVGSSIGILLSKNHEVIMIDTCLEKVSKINKKEAPIDDSLMASYLTDKKLNIYASQSYAEHIYDADLIILALPTNYNDAANSFDTSVLLTLLTDLDKLNLNKTVVIKSTIPTGFTNRARKMFSNLKIYFVPEFLREGRALEDNLNPSRIIVGDSEEQGKNIAYIFKNVAINDPKIFFMPPTEAEAVKLFANTYLATRVSFFNELDSYAYENNLNVKNIIDGVSSDPRIGDWYNNPSFGYGGYCLPKDTKQLLADYKGIPQGIFSAVVKSNSLRKNFIASKALARNPKTIGIFRLVMKKNSENFRDSAIFDIMQIIKKSGVNIIVYEPLLESTHIEFNLTHDLINFKTKSDLILANRMDEELLDVIDKVITRDIYGND